MLIDYLESAMRGAKYKILPEDKVYYGEIPECQGVWATHETLEGCRDELMEVLEDWVLLGIRLNHVLPVINGIDLNVLEVA